MHKYAQNSRNAQNRQVLKQCTMHMHNDICTQPKAMVKKTRGRQTTHNSLSVVLEYSGTTTSLAVVHLQRFGQSETTEWAHGKPTNQLHALRCDARLEPRSGPPKQATKQPANSIQLTNWLNNGGLSLQTRSRRAPGKPKQPATQKLNVKTETKKKKKEETGH